MPLFAIEWFNYTLAAVLIVLSLVLWLVVLIQRGKGGGLAGAFGGAGGSSAFGSKAGDAFTKITLYLAAIWVLVIMISVKTMANYEGRRDPNTADAKADANKPGGDKPADDKKDAPAEPTP